MVSPPDRPILLNFVVQSGHPAILEGLDAWLRLGLLSDETVRQVCAEHLTCLLSGSVTARSRGDDFVVANDFATEAALVPAKAAAVERPPSPIARGIQSFMAEVSVIWLLFLGVFMVVVSSGVLAATQWRNFSTVGQYGILFAYTLAFWVAGVWTNRQANLRLTARMLQVATLLIIPVNFWMMDGLHLWQSGLGWLMAAIAALVLTGITVQLLKPELGSGEWGVGSRERLPLVTAIALSWLHWGWGWTGFPLVATYTGTIGATIALVLQDRRELRIESGEWGVGSGEAAIAPQSIEAQRSDNVSPASPAPSTPPFGSSLLLSTITTAIATLLLIARAVIAAGVPVNRLGLAVGICGWLLCWLGRRDSSRIGWQRGGTGLLLVGWFIAVVVTPPWQAIAISGLGLWLLGDYLRRTGQVAYLTAGWLVGLQASWLLWRVVPPDRQQQLIDTGIRLAGQDAMPIALLGLGFLPYLWLTVGVAFWLRRWQRPDLAQHAELLALALGIVLTTVSLGNGLTRSLNLTLSTLTLVIVLRGYSRPAWPLVYLTHGTALAAIAALIDWRYPHLSLDRWSAILLIGMVGEWSLSAILSIASTPRTHTPHTPHPTPSLLPPPAQIWQQSAWYAGLGFAAISYILLRQAFLANATTWSGMWLATPIALTVLGSRRLPQRQTASGLSVLALFLVQVLMFNTAPERLTSLGTATVLAFINSRQLRQLLVAVVTVGFGLAFAAVAVWERLTDQITAGLSVNFLAIAALVLWLLWGWLRRREAVLARLYRQATDGWAIAVTVLNLLLLTICQLLVYGQLDDPNWQYLAAAVLMLGATSYRLWQQPQNVGFYAIAWSVELVTTGILALTGRSLDAVAIANLALGLGTQLLGDWSLSRRWSLVSPQPLLDSPPFPSSTHPPIPFSWNLIPLFYALLGLLLQHRSLTATTGLYTLAAVLVGIGVGRRRPFRPLVYLSVLGGSIAAYELLIYQLLQAQGGKAGDGIVLLAGLAAAIAIANRLLQRWLIPYLRLSVLEIAAIAHLHWGFGSALMPVALASALSVSGAWLWTGIATTLAAYALAMGNERWQAVEVRRQAPQSGVRPGDHAEVSRQEADGRNRVSTLAQNTPSPLTWSYLGIVEAIVTMAHRLHQWLPDGVLFAWGGTIAAGFAFALYQAPWHRWGWPRSPWQRSAVILPAIVTLITAGNIAIQGLLIVAAFYAWLAKANAQVRLSYLSVLLAEWAISRWLHQIGSTEALWYAALLSASLLYVAQVDPVLRSPNDREKRHLLRSLAAGLVCLTAFYQAEVGITGLPPLMPGLLSIGLQLGFVLAGLLLRVRAFLFVGTAVFMIQILRQIWRFINDYSLLLWAMGIVLGLVFIWVAATFEARRSQIAALMQYWVTELDAWE